MKRQLPKITYDRTCFNCEGRAIVRVVPGVWIMRSRVHYCNAHSITLHGIDGLVVHHDNENITDDSPRNLEAYTKSIHYTLHLKRYYAKQQVNNLDDIKDLS